MNSATLWSLRLGFSNKEAHKIETLGLEPFLEASFQWKVTTSVPMFLNESPKSLDELKEIRQKLKTQSPEEAKERLKKEFQVLQEMKDWWI